MISTISSKINFIICNIYIYYFRYYFKKYIYIRTDGFNSILVSHTFEKFISVSLVFSIHGTAIEQKRLHLRRQNCLVVQARSMYAYLMHAQTMARVYMNTEPYIYIWVKKKLKTQRHGYWIQIRKRKKIIIEYVDNSIVHEGRLNVAINLVVAITTPSPVERSGTMYSIRIN